MIVDAHVYVHPERDGFGSRFDASLEFLMEEMNACEVERAAIFPIASENPYIKWTSNQYVGECCAMHPEKLIGFASIHPLLEPDAPAALARDARAYNLQGLKLHPRFQGFSADDQRIVPLVEQAAELNIPVAIDCLLWKPTPLHNQHPFNIDVLAKRVPKAKIVLCHAGGWLFMEALAVAKANDNVWLDLSLSLLYFEGTPFEEQFLFALRQAGPQRLIYGSDHPQNTLRDTYERSRRLLERYFSTDELKGVYGLNFLSLLPGSHA